jgi:hypothetical protein
LVARFMEPAVDPVELTVGIALAVLLVGVAVYFAYRQQQTLKQLGQDTELSADDRHYLYRQVVRRLFGSVLMIVLAGFLVGWYFLPDMEALRPAEPDAEMPESVKQALRILTYYWIAALMVFLVVLVLAVYDMLATARYGARHRRQLVDDRRAALKADIERLQRDRHRLNGGL